ncbi:MAG: hypothetical protein F6K47_09080 [Symploca sp. SIO2E6]|nr:hypothetical protein [Symploca sp. SIO2E6]
MNIFYRWEAKMVYSGQMSLVFFDISSSQSIGLGSFNYNETTGALESFRANFTTANHIWSWCWDNQGSGNAIIYLRKPTWNPEDGQPHFANRRRDGQSDMWQFFTTHGNETQERFLELILFGSTYPFLLCESRVKNRGLVWLREEQWLCGDYADTPELISA